MQDAPAPSEIVAAVARFLRETVVAEASPHTAFQARVAAGALDLVARQLTLGPPEEAAEHERLRELLQRDGSLSDLDADLASRIAGGAADLTTPGVAAHLWATTLAKLAVDQPTYSGYRAALEEREAQQETPHGLRPSP